MDTFRLILLPLAVLLLALAVVLPVRPAVGQVLAWAAAVLTGVELVLLLAGS